MARYLNNESAALASLEFLASGNDYHKRHLDRYLPAKGSLIDVGCGFGRIAHFYHRPERPAVGLDSDADMVRVAESISGQGGPKFMCGDARKLPFPDGTFSAWVGLGILEIAGVSCLFEARRVLEPSGLLYLTVPFRNVMRLGQERILWRDNVPVTLYSENELRRQIEKIGFRVLLVRRVSIAWGLGPLRPLARLFRRALLREDETSLSYRILAPLLLPFANSILVVGHKT